MALESLNQVEPPSQRDAKADRDKPTEMQMAPRLDEPGVSHGSKRKRPSSVKESCPNECCNCQEQIKDLKSQIELLNTQMEARLHAYVQTHVQGMLSKMQASALPPAKKAKRSVRSQERHCFVCGGHEGTVLNRQLGMLLTLAAGRIFEPDADLDCCFQGSCLMIGVGSRSAAILSRSAACMPDHDAADGCDQARWKAD